MHCMKWLHIFISLLYATWPWFCALDMYFTSMLSSPAAYGLICVPQPNQWVGQTGLGREASKGSVAEMGFLFVINISIVYLTDAVIQSDTEF